MTRLDHPTSLALTIGHVLRWTAEAGQTFVAERGNLWITQEGSREDIVLQPGQRHTFSRDAQAYVSALDDVSVAHVLPAPANDDLSLTTLDMVA